MFLRAAQWLDQSLLGWPFRASEPATAPAFPSGLTADELARQLALVAPHIAPCLPKAEGAVAHGAIAAGDRTPEPGAARAACPPRRTPRRTPKPPRRGLRWYEVPTYTADDFIDMDKRYTEPLDGRHPVEVHALRLLMHIADSAANYVLDDPPISRGTVLRGLFAWQVEHAYYVMCAQHLWWRPHRWEGSGGVAEHFGRLRRQSKGTNPTYRWVLRDDDDGLEHKQLFYPMPAPALAFGQRRKPPTPAEPKRTPKRTPKGKAGKKALGAAPLRRAA